MSSYSGWLAMADIKMDISLVIEYMVSLNVTVNKNSSVQHILETTLATSSEAYQQYAFILFDLATTKWSYNVIVATL